MIFPHAENSQCFKGGKCDIHTRVLFACNPSGALYRPHYFPPHLLFIGCPLIHGFCLHSLLSLTIASTRLFLTIWLKSWESTSQPANDAHLLTPPVSVFVLFAHTRFNRRTSISIGDRPTYCLRLAESIDIMGGSGGELQDLTNRLVDRTKAYWIWKSAQERARLWPTTQATSMQILAWTARS